MWKEFQQAYVLEGHTASVWAVLAIEDDLILTGWFVSSGLEDHTFNITC